MEYVRISEIAKMLATGPLPIPVLPGSIAFQRRRYGWLGKPKEWS
jgi:hypothetical protein